MCRLNQCNDYLHTITIPKSAGNETLATNKRRLGLNRPLEHHGRPTPWAADIKAALYDCSVIYICTYVGNGIYIGAHGSDGGRIHKRSIYMCVCMYVCMSFIISNQRVVCLFAYFKICLLHKYKYIYMHTCM